MEITFNISPGFIPLLFFLITVAFNAETSSKYFNSYQFCYIHVYWTPSCAGQIFFTAIIAKESS